MDVQRVIEGALFGIEPGTQQIELVVDGQAHALLGGAFPMRTAVPAVWDH